MRRSNICFVVILGVLAVGLIARNGLSFKQAAVANASVVEAASELAAITNAEQKKALMLPADTPKRMDWHFIPKNERKGLQVRNMTEQQRAATHELLKTVLSEMGYGKTKEIMRLESLLNELEGGKGSNVRDPLRYYVTFFGKPSTDGAWGLSFEGHHLSLNYWFDGAEITSSTPQFFATNPATVKNKNNSDFPVGTRVLAKEEMLAFELVNSLDPAQQSKAVLADKARREIDGAGKAQPEKSAPVGICISELKGEQKDLLESLIDEYVSAVPEDVANERRADVEPALEKDVFFAWEGAKKPGVGHYYRVQGPTFLIEFVNTQPDAAGNPANHIHCVWRDLRGDFGVKLK